MQVERYLKEYQPIIYKTFLSSLENNHLSHAYLISGNPGTPLLEVAKFLGKSILCDDPSPLACNNCITCLRVDSENYPDFIVYDGSKKTIKKEDVESIESQFEKKAFEAKGIRIYILHLVENMTVESVNSILKFLEEPGSQIYAFLTTNNESAILPTVISRCQNLRLKLLDRDLVINEAVELGVEREDAELLSYFYNSAELILDCVNSEEDDYKNAKEALLDILNALNGEDLREAIYITQNKVNKFVKNKESARFFLDMLAQAFVDMVAIKNQKVAMLTTYATILGELSNKLPHIDESLVEILKDRNLINSNVNIPLLMDHMIINVVKE